MDHSTRRQVLAGAAVSLAAPAVWTSALGQTLSETPFTLGVASGEPAPDGVVLWTRLATRPLEPDGGLGRTPIPLKWEVAEDAALTKRVADGVALAVPEAGHAVHVEVDGLRPDREYWYRFTGAGHESAVGRTRTAPAAGADVERLTVAYASCQKWESGYYAAHRALAADRPDLVLFLGDYIYEARSRVSSLRTDDIAAVDLATYRAKYALYRSDPNLRELHRLHPTTHVWDDHEVENDYTDSSPGPALAQRWAGYRASFEWMPRMAFPRDRHRVYKSLSYGAFADIFMLDERQYRTGSNDGQERHILGEAQMQWLLAGLKASRATWKIVGNPDLLATVSAHPNPEGDAWDGYAADRARLLGAIESASIDNVVFFSGDSHVFMCNLLASDFQALGNGSSRKPSAVEYLPGSVTSAGANIPESQVQATAPWNLEYNGAAHGYGRVAIAADQLVCDYMASDVSNPAGATTLLEHFTQPVGSNHPQRESHAAAARV